MPLARLVAATMLFAVAVSPALAEDAACPGLARDLAAAAGGGPAKVTRYAAAAARQKAAIEKTEAMARARGCRGLFGGSGCAAFRDTLARQRARLAELEAGAGGKAGRREEIRARMKALGCGAAAARTDRRPAARIIRPAVDAWRPTGLPAGSLRTLCVRTCDGYFFPLSFATTPARLDAEEALCRARCPGTEVALFVHPSGTESDTAVSRDGRPYRDMPYAFVNRRTLVAGCGCRPAEAAAADPPAIPSTEDPVPLIP